VALVPQLLGWRYTRLDPELRKAFEVALHAAAAAGMAVAARDRYLPPAGALRHEAGRLALTSAPAALAGLALRRPIERRLGSARSVAIAQIAAVASLWLADRGPTVRRGPDATARDALLVGLAQTLALAPGVSRAGATLTAARLLGFDRPSSAAISHRAALPVIAGAAALEAVALLRGGLPRTLVAPFAAGAGAALASTFLSAPLVRAFDRAGSYAPVAAYRAALGALALARLRRRPPSHPLEWRS